MEVPQNVELALGHLYGINLLALPEEEEQVLHVQNLMELLVFIMNGLRFGVESMFVDVQKVERAVQDVETLGGRQ